MHGHVSTRTARAPSRMRAPDKHPAVKRPIAERPAAGVENFWIKIHREWMTEDAARAFRRRSLLQDNPASG